MRCWSRMINIKNIFISIVTIISSLLGLHNEVPKEVFVDNQIEVSSQSAEIVVTDTIVPTKVVSPTKIAITPLPTKIRIDTAITEEILKNIFGISDKSTVDNIFNSPDILNRYDRELFNKFRSFPIPRLIITSPSQQIVIPRDVNGKMVFAICTGDQLGKVYWEIEKTEKDVEYLKMDMKCHLGGETETKECQDWRRDNDQSRNEKLESLGLGESSSNVEYMIKEQAFVTRKQIDRFNELTGEYCL